MTQLEKAKAYDEALAKAVKIHRNYKGRVRAVDVVIEEVFPELKESEDERIRKAVIKFVEGSYSFKAYDGFTKEDCIAWLEKQDESKNIDSDDLETLKIWEDAIKENKEKWQLSDWFVEATSLLIQKVKRIENNENINIKGSRVMLNACINALRTVGHSHLSDWLEKQGEQKPIDPDTLIQQRVDALADIVAEQKPA